MGTIFKDGWKYCKSLINLLVFAMIQNTEGQFRYNESGG
jgi:hypothetical protein